MTLYLKEDNNGHEREPGEKESSDVGVDGHHEGDRGDRQGDEVDDYKDANGL
jgi:hypothetical protein